jgi:hypothetical protein
VHKKFSNRKGSVICRKTPLSCIFCATEIREPKLGRPSVVIQDAPLEVATNWSKGGHTIDRYVCENFRWKFLQTPGHKLLPRD